MCIAERRSNFRIDESTSNGFLADYNIAVVIPVFNEARQIANVLRGIPSFIRTIIVVDDGSTDGSRREILESSQMDDRVEYVSHQSNRGIGCAMMTGYRRAIEANANIVVKMDGDGQMSPNALPSLVSPLVCGEADYTKGSRFDYSSDASEMPVFRRIGNTALSFMTKVAAGYWNSLDPTNGFTAIRVDVLRLLHFNRLAPRFFFETSMLSELYLLQAVVRDVPISARYRNEVSHLSPLKALIQFPPQLFRNFLRRIFLKHFVIDFSIAALYAIVGMPLGIFGIVFGIWNWAHYASISQGAPTGTVIIPCLCILVSIQLMLGAIEADIRSVPGITLNSGPLRKFSVETKIGNPTQMQHSKLNSR